MRRIVHLGALILLLAGPAVAGTTTWQIDPDHTSAQFAIKHLMVSTVRGTMGPVTGTVTIDDGDITKSSVTASVDAKGIDTRNQKRDDDLRSPNFLDVAKYPSLTFTSKKVEKVADGSYKVTGDLTLRGVTREVVLAVEGAPTPMQDPFGNTKLGGSATTRINRKDFGVNWNKSLDGGGLVVGDDVDITIDIELIKK
ncbi:MAG TPA: YceI family protein [Candidatus Dormibacteraeota bacterium]|nr:YceI family protein [Candidatus Dormibacteraeota bacterium]